MLYDMIEDADAKHDVASSHADLIAGFKAAIETWYRQMLASVED